MMIQQMIRDGITISVEMHTHISTEIFLRRIATIYTIYAIHTIPYHTTPYLNPTNAPKTREKKKGSLPRPTLQI